MTKRNSYWRTLACAGLLAAATLAPSAAVAKSPNGAEIITNEDTGIGCLVSVDFINYAEDPSCEWQLVRRTVDGARVLRNYQDHGQLQPGQTAPSRAVHNRITTTVPDGAGGFLECRGTETVTPSGNYRSALQCN
jgi:hypothetical protein